MIDIKPDTSLYTDLPSRLRAMALVLEGPRGRMQYKFSSDWIVSLLDGDDCDRVYSVARKGCDYRLKPAPPAKLHADITDDGRLAHTYVHGPTPPPMPRTTRVTYVLENPDADD